MSHMPKDVDFEVLSTDVPLLLFLTSLPVLNGDRNFGHGGEAEEMSCLD
jgi:hypothetical protein